MANAIYSNARAKALTNSLLGRDRLKRMIESTPSEAIKILSEVNFGGGINIDSPIEFEKILYQEERNLLSFIRDNSASDDFKKYFLYDYDFHNAEAFIKSKYLKIDPEKMLVCHGLIESNVLCEKISTDDYKFFPKSLQEALYNCDLLFTNNKATGENISSLIKKALFNEKALLSKNNNILKNINEFYADMTNVSIALRTRNFDLARDNFVVGGKISLNELKTISCEQIETLLEKIKFYNNGDVIKTAVECFNKNLPLSSFEKIVDEYSLALLKKQKYSTEGIIPFMLYCYYKKCEINNVRIIMVGLNNGLDKADIEGRIRNGYEG